MKIIGVLLLTLASAAVADAQIFRRHVSSCGVSVYSTPVYYPQVVATPATTTSITNNVYPQVPAYSANWKTDVLKYAEVRDDLNAYERTIASLGIGGYGGNYYGLRGVPNFGTQASTNYGYSFNQLVQSDDREVLLQAVQASGQHGNSLAQTVERVMTGNQQLAAQIAASRAKDREAAIKIADIEARGRAGANIIKSFNGPTTVQNTTTVNGQALVPDAKQPQLQPQGAGGDERAELKAVIAESCIKCHNDTVKKGGVNLKLWDTFTPEQKDFVCATIVNPDSKLMMPRKDDGSPGVRLSVQKTGLFFRN